MKWDSEKINDFSKSKTITNKRMAQVLFGAHLFCFDFIHKTDKLQTTTAVMIEISLGFIPRHFVVRQYEMRQRTRFI